MNTLSSVSKKSGAKHPMAEDSFEKARKAFFGTVTTTPGAYSVEFLKSRDETPCCFGGTKQSNGNCRIRESCL